MIKRSFRYSSRNALQFSWEITLGTQRAKSVLLRPRLRLSVRKSKSNLQENEGRFKSWFPFFICQADSGFVSTNSKIKSAFHKTLLSFQNDTYSNAEICRQYSWNLPLFYDVIRQFVNITRTQDTLRKTKGVVSSCCYKININKAVEEIVKTSPSIWSVVVECLQFFQICTPQNQNPIEYTSDRFHSNKNVYTHLVVLETL